MTNGKWLLALLLATLPFTAVCAGAPKQPSHDALQAELADAFKNGAVTGAALALVENGEVTFARGYGLADKAAATPATPDTVFRAGSIGKSIVGVSVMMLVESGQLSLDDKLADLAPDIDFDNPWEASNPIRLKHLLEHTTGWADLSPREFALDDADMSLLDGLRVGGKRVSRYPPGRYHAYSGAGHSIAALIVEKTAGMPYAEFVRQRIFVPLGMRSATYRRVPGMASSYLPDGELTRYQHYPLYPSGGLNLNIQDLAKFAAFLADEGRSPQGALLQPTSVRRLARTETTLAARAGLPHGYGLGVTSYIGRTKTLFGHGGAIDSFQAHYRYDPAQRRGYAVMINTGTMPPRALRALDAYLGDTGDPLPPAGMPVAAFEKYAGTYQPIAQRNNMTLLLDSLTRFVSVDVSADRVLIDGTERVLLAGGLLQQPDRAAPTYVLTSTAQGSELLGATSSYRRVSQQSVYAKYVYALLFAIGLIAALCAFVVEAIRRRFTRAGTAAIAAFVPLLALVAVLLWATAMPSPLSIARFGSPSWLSVSVFVLTLLLPVGAAYSLYAAFAAGRAGRTVRGIALFSGALLLGATAYLFAYGWVGLRTWALT